STSRSVENGRLHCPGKNRRSAGRVTCDVKRQAQTALHEAFSLAQSTADASCSAAFMYMGDMGSMGRQSTGPEPMDRGTFPMGPMDMAQARGVGHSTVGDSASPAMLASHLLAAVLCGLWLAYGEKAAFRILRAVAGRLAAPLRLLLALPATPQRPRPHLRRRRSERAPRLLLLVHAITSRGPPMGTAVA
ncbi:hypothetical protein ACIRVK_43885, partial [Streptomyces sp. NPDC101152]|uniref:hypothetical protein n=1 Tax=Streptomyces sp. NPDC101152 TaxID=3366116 RepID=UPI00380CCD25